MKTLLNVSILLLCTSLMYSQSCLPTGLIISTQQQIDDFSNDYPACTHILGDLKISGINPTEIISLAGLSQIATIDGSFEIVDNDSLIELMGLENLNYIGGLLLINNNDLLMNLAPLSNLQTLDGDLLIYTNNNLSSLTGLENINEIGAYLWIKENPQLSDLKGLDNISAINSGMSINANNALTNLSGLENLVYVDGDCRVFNNATLSNINAMVNIDMSDVSNLRYFDNPNLSVCGLQNVCTYLNDGNPAEIHDNDVNCNTITEILNNCAPSCSSLPSTLLVNNQSITDGLYQAIDQIESNGVIPNNGVVTFKAGMMIQLNPGFDMGQNISFSIALEPCAN